MNISVNEVNYSVLSKQMQDGTYQLVVSAVNDAIDRGITRIKRNNIVDELLKRILGYASIQSVNEPVGKQVVFDTVVCRITITFNGKHKFNVAIEGNDEVCSKLDISISGETMQVNKTKLEFQSLVVMFTSLLLKNSQDNNTQFVEVFTRS